MHKTVLIHFDNKVKVEIKMQLIFWSKLVAVASTDLFFLKPTNTFDMFYHCVIWAWSINVYNTIQLVIYCRDTG